MTGLTPESRALLKGARDDFEASAAERRRVDSAIADRLGIAVNGLEATPSSPRAGSRIDVGGATSTSVISAKWIGIALLATTMGASGVYLGLTTRPEPHLAIAPAVVSAPLQSRDVATAPSASVEAPPVESPTRVEAAPRAMPQPRTVPSARVATSLPRGTVGEEARLLRAAEDALRSGDASRALTLLDEHARSFPRGVLAEERSAERVSTLCKLGLVADARREAARFLARTPDSPLADDVRRSCGFSAANVDDRGR